jgi:hypothetical protein
VSFPNYSDKYDAPAYLTPETNLERSDVSGIDVPEAVILCYQSDFFEYVTREHTEGEIDVFDGFGRLYSLADTGGQVGVLGGFGIGAPATAIHVERLIARGAEAFCVVGGCAGLAGTSLVTSPSSAIARSATRASRITTSLRDVRPC